MKLKELGAKAGVADLTFLHDGKFFALEIKSEAGQATVAQRDFVAAVIAAGGKAAIGRGLNECLEILEGWQLLRGFSAAKPSGRPEHGLSIRQSA